MKRRSFLKVIGAATAALGVGIKTASVAQAKARWQESYSHWNEPLKGYDRRKYVKRDVHHSYLKKGPEGKLHQID